VLSDNSGAATFNDVSLKHVKALELNYGMQAVPDYAFIISWHVNDANGAKLGEVKIGHDTDPKVTKVKVPLQNVPEGNFNLVMKVEKTNSKETQNVAVINFRLLNSN
jgi:hypothetical protein